MIAPGRICRDGESRRRSPRILAIDASKENREEKKPIQYTRTRFKRKFDATGALVSTSKLAKQVWKGRDSTQNDDHSTTHVEWRSIRVSEMVTDNQKRQDDHAISNGKPSVMPSKQVLGLVLDTLQRRDTYEIFAEPVDPDEVEDYYEIIKEPMDFGTMRAKLHEGFYENLEQFEHDVFLIPENAMHFNSSTTVYFRQARAIHELAKKVFHALKTDPGNFEMEFSGTRRRSVRKALMSDVSFKGTTMRSPTGPSTFRRASRKNDTDQLRSRTSTGNRLSSFDATDRRSSFMTWRSSFCNDGVFVGSSQPLVLVNRGEIRYEYSLMSFVKDLGPVAQMVAKRKLCESNCSKQPENIISSPVSAPVEPDNVNSVKPSEYRTFRDFACSTPPFLKISNTVELTRGGEDESREKKKSDFGSVVKEKTVVCIPAKEKSVNGVVIAVKERRDSGEVVATSREMRRGGSAKNKSVREQDGKVVRPVILALENPYCSVAAAEYKRRNKRSRHVSGLDNEEPPVKPVVVTQFTFDLAFLKARLSEMKGVAGRGGFPTSGDQLKRPLLTPFLCDH